MIFILGGGGWVESSVYYRPATSALMVKVSIGLAASASLALDFGVVRGSVGVYLGMFVDYEKTTGESGVMNIGVVLVMRGEVDVLGIISVMVTLTLEVVYLSDGQRKSFYGRGTLSLSIRICWCFKINIRKSVTQNFGGQGSTFRSSGPTARQVAGIAALASASVPSVNYPEAAKAYADYML